MRFLAIVGAIVILVLVAVYLGWFGFSSSANNDGNHESVEISMDKAKIRSDTAKVTDEVKDIARDTGEGVRKIAAKVENGFSGKQKPLLVADKKAIELEPGASATIKLTRSGGELTATHLILTPSVSSNLLVTGGDFKSGETETAVVIEAPTGAKDGSVNVEGNGDSQRVEVVIKSKI